MRMHLAARRLPAVLVVPAAVAAAVALLPVVYLIERAGDGGWAVAVDVLLRARTAELLARSLALAATVTAACIVIGVGLAWLVTRTDLPGRRAWAVLAALPLAVPSYVAAFTWLAAMPSFAGFTGAALVLTLVSYPYVFLPTVAALRGMDPAQEEVSRSLGAGPLRTFLRVGAREIAPAVGGGALLVALYTLSDFGAVSLMRCEVFTQAIYVSYRGSFDRTPAAVLGCLLVAVTLVLVLAEARTRTRAQAYRVDGAPRRPAPPTRLGRGRWPMLAAPTAVAGLALGVPAASLVWWLARGSSSSLGADSAAGLGAATLTSLWLSLAGAAATCALAVPVGVLAGRYRGLAPRWLERCSYLGHALPGIVVALALVFFGVRYAQPLYQRSPLLVGAYAVLFLPLAVAATRAAAVHSPPVLEEVARSLGRRPRQVFATVTLPLAGPGVAAGAALVFLACMKELPATLLLRPTGAQTLATRLWTHTDVAAYGAAAPYAAVLILAASVPTYLLSIERRGRRGHAGAGAGSAVPTVPTVPGGSGAPGGPAAQGAPGARVLWPVGPRGRPGAGTSLDGRVGSRPAARG